MRLPSPLFMVESYQYDSSKRKHSFRCRCCGKVLKDGESVILERQPLATLGYHSDCFKDSLERFPTGAAAAAVARAKEAFESGRYKQTEV